MLVLSRLLMTLTLLLLLGPAPTRLILDIPRLRVSRPIRPRPRIPTRRPIRLRVSRPIPTRLIRLRRRIYTQRQASLPGHIRVLRLLVIIPIIRLPRLYRLATTIPQC